MVVAGQPLANTPFTFNAVEGLHAVPGHPFVGSLLVVAAFASWNDVGGAVFSSFRLRTDVIDS